LGTPARSRSAELRGILPETASCVIWLIMEAKSMCRNIRMLFNFELPATEEEVHAAALQFVRKISGFTKPSAANKEAFEQAVDQIAKASSTLLGSLVTTALPRNREVESARVRARAQQSRSLPPSS
jgi:hypothetical protein